VNLAQGPRHQDLYDEIDELRERNRQLEDMLAGAEGSVVLDGLTPAEQRVFNCLMKHDRPSTEMLHHAAQRPGAMDDTDPKGVDVRIHYLRRKLKPYRVVIHNSWGQGKFITPDDKEKVRRHVEQRQVGSLRAGTLRG
jgi:DNA-binding response OmpR family regulator